MLEAIESHLCCPACDVATNSLNKFFSSVIARLNAVRDDGGDIREAYEAILLGEEGTARRMPSDAEFERTLRMSVSTIVFSQVVLSRMCIGN